MSEPSKLPISALIVVFNEAKVLNRCLRSIQFCDEIVVYDLGSTDDSIEVAEKAGAIVRSHEQVPHAEIIYAKELVKLRHDWVLVTDPDEEIDPALRKELIDDFEKMPKNTAVVRAPMQYYFKSHALKGTIWGGVTNRQLLVLRKHAHFRPLVNTPIAIDKNYEVYWWPYKSGLVHHYWMNGYLEFLKKHIRYLSREGEARYTRGERIGYRGILRTPWRSFYESFFTARGYRDGLTGFFLSLFWSWYNTTAFIRLKRLQLKKGI